MRLHILPVWVSVAVICLALLACTTKDVAEYCQNESFKAKCGKDQVIVMTSALYGRMRFSKCIERDYGYVGQCSVNVLDSADLMCSGRRDCEIEIPNSILDARRACPKDLKSYLETTHTCIKVMSPDGKRCRHGTPHVLQEQSGLLASVLTEETGLGSADCPWMIQARPGQKINITLFDFATTQLNGEVCHAYAILRETDPTRSITVCGSTKRERNVYTSISETVDIRILRSPQNTNNRGKYFILKYDFIGCADPAKPTNGWVNRDGDTVTLGCMINSESWKLTCKDNKWVGVAHNCTGGANTAGVIGEVSWGGTSLPFGISIVIIIGIALAIGVVILTVGLLILKWQRRRTAAKAARLQNENPYEPGRKPSNGRTPGSPKDIDPYYSTENEYAYIADVPTPTPPPLPPLPPNRETYNSMKRFTFNQGSNGNPTYPVIPTQQDILAGHVRPAGYVKNTNAHGLREEQPRYEDMPAYPQPPPQPMDGEDPPKYFELDPKVVKGDNIGLRVHSPPHDGMSYQNDAPSLAPLAPAPRIGVIGGTPRSLHDFSPNGYDHLGGEESRNLKSA